MNYTTAKILLTTKKIEIVDEKKFTVVALNANNETLVIYIAVLMELIIMPIYFFC